MKISSTHYNTHIVNLLERVNLPLLPPLVHRGLNVFKKARKSCETDELESSNGFRSTPHSPSDKRLLRIILRRCLTKEVVFSWSPALTLISFNFGTCKFIRDDRRSHKMTHPSHEKLVSFQEIEALVVEEYLPRLFSPDSSD